MGSAEIQLQTAGKGPTREAMCHRAWSQHHGRVQGAERLPVLEEGGGGDLLRNLRQGSWT